MHIANVFSKHQFKLSRHWPWLVSLALLCFVAELTFGEIPSLQQQHVDLTQAQKRIARQITDLTFAKTNETGDQLLIHLATFERLSVVTHDLHTLSQENGLILSDAIYKTVNLADHADVQKVEISARLKGAYQPLKKMLGLLLASHEGLSLESVSIRRNHANDASSDIELQLAFYFRAQT